MKKVLITGAAGFIGSHLAEYHLSLGDYVVGIDNFSTGQRIEKQNFEMIELDVCESWSEIKTGFHLIYHLASPASVPAYQKLSLETLWVNSLGLKNAIAFADQQNARLIFSSTSEVYGSPLRSPQNEKDWGLVNSYGPRSCYDEAKRFGEALIYSSNLKNKTQHGLVRIFNTYGPRMRADDGRVVIQFLQQALQNQDITVYGDGQQTRSLCYIDDLIQGIHQYALSNYTEPFNLGNDTEIKMFDLAKLVIDLTNSKSKIIFKDLPVDEPLQRRPDLTEAKNKLGYQYKIYLREGLLKTINQTRHSSRM